MALWLVHYNPSGFKKMTVPDYISLDNRPFPTVMAGGVLADSHSHYWILNTDSSQPSAENNAMEDQHHKPGYRVPGMAEIEAIPWNGLTAVSTFSGCGGSSLGYRMAGFKVLWASEFVDLARQCYIANHPNTIVDDRDIRDVDPADILQAIGMERGEIDLLDGSPPCASFSTAGKRHRNWGKKKTYSDRAQRTDDLFFEFARILDGLQPKTFVAENVSGLIKGTAKGYFKHILAKLKSCGYRVEARLLDAQWLGVPQARQRLIFVGVRNDIDMSPVFPKPLPYRYTVREAIPWIDSATHHAGGFQDHPVLRSDQPDQISPTITATQRRMNVSDRPTKQRVVHDTSGQFSNGDITDKPSCTVTVTPHFYVEKEAMLGDYAVGREYDRLAPGGQSEKYFQLVRPDENRPCPTITAAGGNASTASVTHPHERRKLSIAELRRICAFPDDFELIGGYTKQWERLGRSVPPIMMRHIAETIRDHILLPAARQQSQQSQQK